MSTRVSSVEQLESPLDDVFRVLTAASWVEHKAAALHDGGRVVDRQATAEGGVLLVVSRTLPRGAPGFVERFLPADGRLVQSDRWEGGAPGEARSGTWSVALPGAPATLGGTMRLDPAGTGTRYAVDGQVEVRVPLIGGKAERYVAEMVGKLARKEAALLRRELEA